MEYAGDKNTWKSVTGYFIIINGVVIKWYSQIKKAVTLSVIESQYSEISGVRFKILLSVKFYFLWGLLLNYPLPCTLIMLDLYSYRITHQYPNG